MLFETIKRKCMSRSFMVYVYSDIYFYSLRTKNTIVHVLE